jgi:hypothetical protein
MERDGRETAVFVLLVVQASLALLASLGLVVYASASGALAALGLPLLLGLGGTAALLVLAVGRARGWGWAGRAVVVYEVLVLLGSGFAILTSRGQALTLSLALAGLALPLAVAWLPLGRDQLAVGLLLVTGIVHLALAPEHLKEAPTLGVLFALDGVAAVGLGLLSFRVGWWRRPAAMLMAASIAAYVVVLLKRTEGVDDLAMATKLVEIAALGLLLAAPRRWIMPASSVLLATLVTGTIAWGAELRGSAGHDIHSHDTGKVVQAAAPPTAEQRAAADQLIQSTRDDIARYADLKVALADGYRPSTPPQAPTVHYANAAYLRDGHVLDPARPEELVYANTPSGPLLLGAMFMMPKANEPGPAVGGALTEWHVHTNLCFALPSVAIGGFLSPFGTCPPGMVNAPTPAMLHVWTVPNPAGPFGDLPPAYVARLTGGRA